MSTILKALRRLEEDKAKEEAALRKHGEVVAPGEQRAPASGSRALFIGMAGAASVMIVVGAGLYLFAPGSDPAIQRVTGRTSAPVAAAPPSTGVPVRQVDTGGQPPAAADDGSVPATLAAEAAIAPSGSPPAEPAPRATGAPEATEPVAAAENVEVAAAPVRAVRPPNRGANLRPKREGARARPNRARNREAIAPPAPVQETLPWNEREEPAFDSPDSRDAADARDRTDPQPTEQPSGPALGPAAQVVSLPVPHVQVVKTVWHPQRDRRVVHLAVEDGSKILQLREGDAYGGLVVGEIALSKVTFHHGSVTITRRVGESAK